MKRPVALFAVCIACSVLLFPNQVKAQIVINEFMASNTGSVVDPDFNESADWIELYNAGPSDVNIGGYWLTDNFNNKQKWQIPAGTSINSHGFIIIWADSRNTGLHTSFNISASGEELAIFNQAGNLIDSVSFGLQEPNISMGRKTDGGPAWGFSLNPTPGATNSNETFNGITHNKPQYSVLGGIFNSPLTVEITNTFGGEIRYTTDGSEPSENSSLVNGPIQITKTTIIRSRIYQQGKVPGKIITHSYFIDSENIIGSLPLVSIATNPENFWDPVKGIYVQNFKPEWEVPINIELFENDGSDRAGFNLTAGTKVNGLYSWQLPQKMLGIYFRKEYGEGKLDYPLLFDQERNSYNSFALRASGSDWANSMFRDGMTQSLTIENMDVDFQGFRAAVLFVNGRYMGINNIRAKVDEDLILETHQLVGQEIDMIENENYTEAGTLDQYLTFKTLYQNDLSIQLNFDLVAEQMDIENFTDFIITEIYSQNTSVDHNIMAWKPQSGGKWKWILNDLDRGFFKAGSNLIGYYADRSVYPFNQLLKNNSYKKYFGKRLADHLFTTFEPERVKAIVDNFRDNIKDEIPNHIERWKGTTSSYGNPISSVIYWYSEVDKMKTFAEARPTILLNDLINYGFGGSTPLSVAITPANAGTINFNGIKIKQALSQGGYPENEEITLVAEPKGGYHFIGWQRSEGVKIINREEIWKYYDKGVVPDTNWISADFDDSDWNEGQAELGYGDGDEKAVVSFGGNSRNKYITTYFRKTVTIENAEKIKVLKINLKCDDGSVVYINGNEAFRSNLPTKEITGNTLALSTISGSDESSFTTFTVDPNLLKTGKNTVSVEIHQDNIASSDISFDLELIAKRESEGDFLSTNSTLKFIHTGDESVTAVFESDGSCILPEEITAEMVLNKACSPYRVPNNVLVSKTGKLIIEPGVELWFSDDVSIKVNGSIAANGTVKELVIFRSNPNSKNKKWGILNFVNAETSYLKNVVIEDASKGNHPQREIAAISVFNSVLKIDGAVLENNHKKPIIARYSDISLKNSTLYSETTGDLINVKYGKGFIDSCVFTGNKMPDNDAIDYDDVENGIIRNSVIHDFLGFNSADAMSTLKISHSVSDNDFLPAGKNNLFANPLFQNPNGFDFRLAVNSPCILAGNNGNMGVSLNINETINQLYISAVAYKSDLISEVVEFIELSNSGNTGINLSGYEFTKGITFRFPEGSAIKAGEKVYVTFNSNSDFWLNRGQVVFQWESGRLADEGEAIQLKTPQGVIDDQVFYNFDHTWPKVSNGEGIVLKSETLDNHFGENWKVSNMNTIVHAENMAANLSNLSFYPNPTSGILIISGLETEEIILNIYNLTGVLVKSQIVNSTFPQVNIENLSQGIYLVRCGNVSQRVVLMK